MEDKPLKQDASGYEVITDAVRALLNKYPGLYEDERIRFEESGEESGIIFSSNSGAVVYSEKKYVSGTVVQKCQYQFFVIYRTSASQKEDYKLTIVRFLEKLGKWLSGESVDIQNVEYELDKYPDMIKGRKIEEIAWNNVYSLEPNNGVQDWVLPVTVRYTNTFKKRSM